MSRQIYVNLPVKDLNRSVAFFTQLGFTFNPRFTDGNATCMIVAEGIFVMLLVEKFFLDFTSKSICDARKSAEVMLALSCENRAEVDELVRKALAAGGTVPRPPQDLGFMYALDFKDPDGHIRSPFYMEPGGAPQEEKA
ncbi:MAG: VOC family protein [Nitrosomonadales bacterium]|nr:VOC family protein [Nitrosomonadales bacterium]